MGGLSRGMDSCVGASSDGKGDATTQHEAQRLFDGLLDCADAAFLARPTVKSVPS